MGGGQDHRSVSSYFDRVIRFSPARKLGIVARLLLRFRACDSTIGEFASSRQEDQSKQAEHISVGRQLHAGIAEQSVAKVYLVYRVVNFMRRGSGFPP